MFRFYAGMIAAILTFGGNGAHAGGIGVIGDSYSDEYRFYAPHRSAARNWVEILAETRGVDFGEMATQARGEPRNEGYAFNWAKNDATTSDMIASGQHTGLAAQAARGEVSIAVLFIGGNDAIHALYSPSPASALEGMGRRAAANIRTAVDALMAASPEVKVLLVTVPDVRELPEFRDALQDGRLSRDLADVATAELDVLNTEIRQMARLGARVGVMDFARISRVSSILSPKFVPISGRRVERDAPGDGIDHLFLGDVRHLGTIGQGMFARLVVDALNGRFGAGIEPLDDRQIVAFAERLQPTIAALKPEGPQAAEAGTPEAPRGQ